MIEHIEIPRDIYARLLQLTGASPKFETCGLFGGDGVRCRSIYPITNVAQDRARAFVLDAREHIAAMRMMRAHGEQLSAIYHSHPRSAALPSAADLAAAAYPGVGYLIVSLEDATRPAVNAFVFDGQDFNPIRLEVNG